MRVTQYCVTAWPGTAEGGARHCGLCIAASGLQEAEGAAGGQRRQGEAGEADTGIDEEGAEPTGLWRASLRAKVRCGRMGRVLEESSGHLGGLPVGCKFTGISRCPSDLDFFRVIFQV